MYTDVSDIKENRDASAFASVVIFDTETTGLPKTRGRPYNDLDNWPRIVEIAWQIFGKTEIKSYLIRPNGFTIPAEASAIHGITTEQASGEGVDIKEALTLFLADVRACGTIVAHNLKGFDLPVVRAEMLRAGLSQDVFNGVRCIDTLQPPYPGLSLSKWYREVFSSPTRGAHRAAEDVRTLAALYNTTRFTIGPDRERKGS